MTGIGRTTRLCSKTKFKEFESFPSEILLRSPIDIQDPLDQHVTTVCVSIHNQISFGGDFSGIIYENLCKKVVLMINDCKELDQNITRPMHLAPAQTTVILSLLPFIVLADIRLPDELREHFDGQKIVLPLKRGEGKELLEKWHNDAHMAVIDAVARESFPEYFHFYDSCATGSTTIRKRAKCFVECEKRMKFFRRKAKFRRRKRHFRDDRQLESAEFGDENRNISSARGFSLSHGSSDNILTITGNLLKNLAEAAAGSSQRSWKTLQREMKEVRKEMAQKENLKEMFSAGRKSQGGKSAEGSHNFKYNGYPKEKRKRIRLLSPGIYPEDPNEIAILSPRIPIDSSAAKAWMDFILTASGAKKKIEKTIDLLKSAKEKDEPLRLTEEDVEEIAGKKEKRKIETMRKMERMYTKEQMNDFRSRGFSFMTPAQQRVFYGKRSPMANPRLLREVSRMSPESMKTRLIRSVRLAAEGEKRLHADAILSPIVFTTFYKEVLTGNTVLSPVFFSAYISAPTVIGPLILSPWIFSPLILSPWIFCPVVLAPFAGAPMILSPVSTSVYVLSPGILSPFVLSPLVMVPFVLSPSAGSPLILSPIALSPFILNPSFGSPTVLSPSVLSPAVYSPTLNSSVVLSPSALSPAIESDGEGSDVILSPSI